ncbi:hypothetical protein EJF36_14735 [Bacillus sp. HMF5848]|uniref:hypothetical protein n=1 Tax=Bacillus sp. HMF5848 TaxID=2495421 RepID=UPI000F79065F|nr:hypothetical protein [Bacillus sp. HMF5848]RSK28033.1 hypothetical protein EJF36_14735 [Bacillus sp. HMF5848]
MKQSIKYVILLSIMGIIIFGIFAYVLSQKNPIQDNTSLAVVDITEFKETHPATLDEVLTLLPYHIKTPSNFKQSNFEVISVLSDKNSEHAALSFEVNGDVLGIDSKLYITYSNFSQGYNVSGPNFEQISITNNINGSLIKGFLKDDPKKPAWILIFSDNKLEYYITYRNPSLTEKVIKEEIITIAKSILN